MGSRVACWGLQMIGCDHYVKSCFSNVASSVSVSCICLSHCDVNFPSLDPVVFVDFSHDVHQSPSFYRLINKLFVGLKLVPVGVPTEPLFGVGCLL